MKPTDTKGTEYKRRDILKHAAVTTGGLVVGATAISGRATARQTGGKALAFGEDFVVEGEDGEEDSVFVGLRRRTPFKVLAETGEPVFLASCKSSESAEKTWTDFLIEYSDDEAVSIMATRNHKQVKVGYKYEFTSAQATDCPAFPGAVKTGFKPAR